MDMNQLKGRIFEQQTLGEIDKDGYWKVVVTITEKISYDGEVWEVENISAMSLDKSFDMAHKIAMQSALSELNSLVYSKGFDSLIEGRLYERLVKENASNNNKDTTTQ